MTSEFEQKGLRSQLTKFALKIRPTNESNGSSDEPELAYDYEYNDGERVNSRIKIYLRSRGCVSATCTMCPMPSETAYNSSSVTAGDYIRQFSSVFKDKSINNYDIICVYNSGNWFADKEVPPKARKNIYEVIASSKARAMMVQSLPQFITEETVKEAKDILGDKKLIVGIGLQSSNDIVRNLCINTTCAKNQFEESTRLLAKNGYSTETYVMIKPPFLTEKEAIQDTVSSIRYLNSIGFRNASICPTRVSQHTVAWELAKRNLYKPPSLWTVVDILKELKDIKNFRVRVACLDIDERDNNTYYPKGCEECSAKVLSALRQYNIDSNISKLDNLSCGNCEDEHLLQLKQVEKATLQERVRDFLNFYQLGKMLK